MWQTGRVDTNNVQNVVGDKVAGYIFMCNTKTKPDCFIYRVFGLPASRIEVVEKIKPNTNLFLFDFDLKLLYGLYVADSSGKLAIEPCAFGGRFPAQVKFSIVRDCLPLPEVAFKDVIKENYTSGSKFNQELSDEQVNKLVSLFRPITISLPPRPSPHFHNAVESLHPGFRGSSVQIAKLPSHGQYDAHSGLTDIQLHPSHSLFQDVPLPPPHLAHNQVALVRHDKVALQPRLSQPSCRQFDSAHLHQAYHPDDPGLHQHDTHVRNAYMHPKSSSTVVPQVPSANSYYGLNPMPHSNISPQQPQAVTPSSTMASSSLTASQWVAMASQALTPGAEASSYVVPSSSDPNAYYGSNSTAVTYHYQNQGYPGSYQEPLVINDPHQASSSTYYQQTQTLSSGSNEVGVHQAYMRNGMHSTALASDYQYQGYHQMVSVTPDQHVSYDPSHVSGHTIEYHPVSQVTVPGGGADPVAGYAYAPTYSSGANPTY